MKKLITFIMVFALAIFANAEDATFDVNAKDVVYIEGVLQTGVEGNLSIMLKNSSKAVGTITYVFSMPEGVSMNVNAEGDVEDIVTDGSFVCHQQPDGSFKLAINYGKTWGVSTTARSIASIPVNCSASVGKYEIEATSAQVIFADNTGVDFADFSTTITVQNTAVIEDQDPNYALEVIPFVVSKDATSVSIPVNMVNQDEVAYISFDVEFPAGITPSKSGRAFAKPTVNEARLTNGGEITPLSAKAPTLVSGTTYHYELANEEIDTYASNGTGLAMTLPAAVSADEGVYTLKLKNIKIQSTTDYETFASHTGEYYASVIVGQPAAQEVILYGHYTKDAVNAFNTAMKNIAVANITATTIDNGVGNFQDVITVDDSNNWVYYFRKSENYATTVMPYELKVFTAADFPELNLEEKEPYCQLFTVESMTAESIVIKELPEGETIPANTPCIFKGVLTFLKTEEPLNLGSIKEQILGGTTFMGTYEATEIADGAGYYISSDGKFYSDGATVRPFRGYFDGTIAGVKSFSVKLDTANGLIDITDQFSAEDIYSLQGIKMNKTQKGVNIVNGKKVYVK